MKHKTSFTVEYAIRCSPSILFELLSTTSGLQEWFAEKVDRKDDAFYFTWEDSTDEAICLSKVENEQIRFRWEGTPEEEYFQFDILISEVTNQTILKVTDFAYDFELQDQKLLWDTQIEDLKRRIGG